MPDFRQSREREWLEQPVLNYHNDPSYIPQDQLGGPGMGGAGNESGLSPAHIELLDRLEGGLNRSEQLGQEGRGLMDAPQANYEAQRSQGNGLDVGGIWQGMKDAGSQGMDLLSRGLNAMTPSQDSINNLAMRFQNAHAIGTGQPPLYMRQQQQQMEMANHQDLMQMKRAQLAQQLQDHKQKQEEHQWKQVFSVLGNSNISDPQQEEMLKRMAKEGHPIAHEAAQAVNAKMLGDFKLVQDRLGMAPEEIMDKLQKKEINWYDLAAKVTVEKKNYIQEKEAVAQEEGQRKRIQGLYDKFKQDPYSMNDTELETLGKHRDAQKEREMKILQLKAELTGKQMGNEKSQLELQQARVLPQYGTEVHKAGGKVERDRFDPQTGQLTKVVGDKPPSTQVINKIDMEKGKSLAKEVGEIVKGTRDKAVGAVNTINTAHQLHAVLETGKVNLGPAASVRQYVDRIADSLQVAGKNQKERLANTRVAIKSLAEFALSSRDQLKGTGQISNYEQQIAERASAGDITDFSISELQTFIRVVDKAARLNYGLHEQQIQNMANDQDPQIRGLVPYYKAPGLPKELPPVNLPKGIPEGSNQIGTSKGKPVWQSPDGKKWVVD